MKDVIIIPTLRTKKGSTAAIIVIRGYFKRTPVKAISTGYKIQSDQWDAQNRRVKDTAPNADLINVCLQQKLQSIQAEILKREIAQQEVNEVTLATLISGGINIDFLQYSLQVIEDKKLKDGKPYGSGTKKRYHQEVRRLKQYRDKIAFKDITVHWLTEYSNWLHTCSYLKVDEKRLHSNSIWKALSFIRMVWHEAVKQKIIADTQKPFNAFQVGNYKRVIKKIKYLNIEQVDAIEKMLIERNDSLLPRTLQVGWRFLFMCVSGLRISDAWQLPDIIIKGFMMEFNPHKTKRSGNTAQIPVSNERQQRYLQKTLEVSFYKVKTLEYARELFNEELRLIGRLAGIDMHITSHVGRHSMGSFLVDSSIDNKAAKLILGVKSDEVIRTYMHLKESKLISEAKKLDGVF